MLRGRGAPVADGAGRNEDERRFVPFLAAEEEGRPTLFRLKDNNDRLSRPAALPCDLPRRGRSAEHAELVLQDRSRARPFRAVQGDVQPTLDIAAGAVLLVRYRASADDR